MTTRKEKLERIESNFVHVETADQALSYCVQSMDIMENLNDDFPFWTIRKVFAKSTPNFNATKTRLSVTVFSTSGKYITNNFLIEDRYLKILKSVSVLNTCEKN